MGSFLDLRIEGELVGQGDTGETHRIELKDRGAEE